MSDGRREKGSGGAGSPADSLRHFRLLPRRKLPVLPPRGDRWGGLLHRSTLIVVGGVVLLVVAVVVAVATVRSSAPTTLDGVTEEAAGQLDRIVDTLPEPPVADDTTTVVQPCPDGSVDEQAALTRILTPAGDFDPRTWAGDLRATLEADGWHVTVDPTGTIGGVDVRLVDRALVPVSVIAVPAADGADARITLTTDSRCTDEG